jgi:Holliday junction resolvase RusA-like endonuclease
VYEDRKHPVAAWKAAVAQAVYDHYDGERHDPFVGALQVNLLLVMPRPKSIPKGQPSRRHHIVKPDGDNLAKSILDAITGTGMLWTDDSQIAVLGVTKLTARLGEEPHAVITMSPLGPYLDTGEA